MKMNAYKSIAAEILKLDPKDVSLIGEQKYSFTFKDEKNTKVIKIIKPNTIEKPLVGNEIEALKRTKSKRVVNLIDEGVKTIKGREYRYLIFPYIPGRDLDDLLRERKKKQKFFTNDKITNIGLQISQAIADLERSGVIHQDIKPKNIRIKPNGEIILLDLGIARFREIKKEPARGPYKYLSPEQIELYFRKSDDAANRIISFSSDHFSLGTLLYELATLKNPFEGHFDLISEKEPGDPLLINKKLYPDLKEIILKLLRKKPHQRFLDPSDLVKTFQGKCFTVSKKVTLPRFFYQQTHSGSYKYFLEIRELPLLRKGEFMPEGVIISLAHKPADKTIRTLSDQGYKMIFDPKTYLLGFSQEEQTNRLKKMPYGRYGRISPASFSSRIDIKEFTREVIDTQWRLQADYLISPYFYLEDSSDPFVEVNFRLWEEARKYKDTNKINKPLLGGLLISERIIKKEKDRSRLLDQAIFNPFVDGIYLLSQDERLQSFPLEDESIIKGFLEIMTILGKKFPILLLHGDTIALGYLANGLDAVATNPDFSMRKLQIDKFEKGRTIRGRGKRRPRLYIQSLMNTILEKEAQDIVRRKLGSLIKCQCPFCGKINYRDTKVWKKWTEEDGYKHFLHVFGREIYELGQKKNRGDWFKKRIKKAKLLYKKLEEEDIPLERQSRGEFLKIWEKIF